MSAVDVRPQLQTIASVLERTLLPADALFTLLVWTDDMEGHGAHYVSNANREDVIRAMRETAGRLEGRPAPPSEN